MEYYYLKIYESIEKNIGTDFLEDNIRPFSIRPFNVSIVKLDNENYLYAVRTAIVDLISSSKKHIPGNRRKVCDISPGENFMWNNWNYAGLEGLTFFIGDHKKNNLNIQKALIIKSREMVGAAWNYLRATREYYVRARKGDSRLTKISGEILLYVTNMSEVYTINFQKDEDLIVLTWNSDLIVKEKFNAGDMNLQMVKIDYRTLTYINWFTENGVLIIIGTEHPAACYIKYTDNIILGRGSYDNSDENDKKLLKNNYGIMPSFSFSTPHIPIKYNGKDALLGVGHIRIHSSEAEFPYLEGSRIENFRRNLYDDMGKKYGNKYIKHYGSSAIECLGYIYMMYFYVLLNIENDLLQINPNTKKTSYLIPWQMKLSDAYLPLDTSTRVEKVDPYDEFYQFSLVFPMGLAQRDDETIIVTCGVGDFYSVALEFKLKEVLESCIHDASNTDMRNYKYYIIQQADKGLLFGERLTLEPKTNGYYKKYLKYKKKYLGLKKRLN